MAGNWRIYAVLLLFLVPVAGAQTGSGTISELLSAGIPKHRMDEYADLAVRWQQEYLRIDTTNPPGNEMRAAAFLKGILDKEGIVNRVFEYAPGRADLWARIPSGSGASARPIIMLNHMDVVTSDASHWKVP